MAHTQYACGWIRPTQSDCRCGLSLFGLGTPTPFCESRITAYLQPVQVLCLTIKQVEQMGFLRWPRPALVNFFPPHAQSGWLSYLDMCSCSVATSTNPFSHRATSSSNPWAAMQYFCPFPHATSSQYSFLFFLLCARARRSPGQPDYKMPCILNVSPSTVRVPRARLKLSTLMGMHYQPASLSDDT